MVVAKNLASSFQLAIFYVMMCSSYNKIYDRLGQTGVCNLV